jgi:hypothetical protein
LREEKQTKYNVSVPFRVQSTIDVSSPRVLVRECGRILEQVGCAKSCSPDSSRFVETSGLFANSFWICPEYCEEFFQYCVDVTEQRFVNAQTFCEQQRLDNGLQVRVRDFSCYSAGRLAATPDQSFAYGRALYGGAANQLATFYVQAVDRFGNYKTRGGDAFIPSLFDSRGVPTPIKIVDNDDGTYTVTFSPKPDTYTIDVTLNGASIRNVPRKATFGGSSKCILPPVAGLLPKPQPDLATCVEFSGNACCDNFILRPWGEAFESVYVNYAGTPVCKSAIDHLLCGIPCSPTQSRELRLNTGRKCPLLHEDDDDGGVGGEKAPFRITDEDDDDAELEPDVCESPVLAILTVCRDYCRRVYEACSDCKAADRGVTVASAFDTQEAFCRSLAPKGYRIEVGDEPNCFGSSQDASLSGSFAQLESVSRARASAPRWWRSCRPPTTTVTTCSRAAASLRCASTASRTIRARRSPTTATAATACASSRRSPAPTTCTCTSPARSWRSRRSASSSGPARSTRPSRRSPDPRSACRCAPACARRSLWARATRSATTCSSATLTSRRASSPARTRR